MSIEEKIFQKSQLVEKKLLTFGFQKQKDKYYYQKNIMNNKFLVDIIIDKDNRVSGKIYDNKTREEYTNFRIENFGAYANLIRDSYFSLLKEIRDNCFISKYFNSKQANRLVDLIKKEFNSDPEFLWDRNPNYGVFRDEASDKWLAIIMSVSKDKIIPKALGEVEIINVKVSDLNKKGLYPAYHMNKDNWASIILDDSLTDQEIMELIKLNYDTIAASHTWLIPANPKYFDLITAFKQKSILDWHKITNINDGDIVYIYVTQPYSAILYRCLVTMSNSIGMKMKLERKYDKSLFSLDKLKEFGVTAVRSPRRIPNKLAKILEKA